MLKIVASLVWNTLITKIFSLRRPIFVGLYITNACNLRCSYCFVNLDKRFDDNSRRGFSRDEIFKIVDELYKLGTRWIFLLGGEPLLHENIGEIVRYIVNKGILLHILTNGILIEKKIDEIEPAHAICVSVDGDEAENDKIRGEGSFQRAVRGIKAAQAHEMKVRIHATLTRYTLGTLESLAQFAKENGLMLTFSPLNYIGTTDVDAFQITDDEYRNFWKRYKGLKRKGYPIGNSFYCINKALNWPIGYHEFIKKGEDRFPGYKPMPCVIGTTHGCIDAEGTMFNCIQLGCQNGLNIQKAGIKKAWHDLLQRRPHCVSCSSINTIETSAYLNLRPEVLLDAFKFTFFRLDLRR